MAYILYQILYVLNFHSDIADTNTFVFLLVCCCRQLSRQPNASLQSCLEQPACGGLDLGAFLLTPVQRVPRYILLMKQLLKYTEPQHPDYQHLHACLERLRDFLARLNDSMEHSFQLVHAQLSPHGTVPGPAHHHPPPPQPPTSLHRYAHSGYGKGRRG